MVIPDSEPQAASNPAAASHGLHMLALVLRKSPFASPPRLIAVGAAASPDMAWTWGASHPLLSDALDAKLGHNAVSQKK
jgi:hypothetical protein